MRDRPEQLSLVECLALAEHATQENEFMRAEVFYKVAHNLATSIANNCMEQMRYVSSRQRDADKEARGKDSQ